MTKHCRCGIEIKDDQEYCGCECMIEDEFDNYEN
jgi:hypothetical protein